MGVDTSSPILFWGLLITVIIVAIILTHTVFSGIKTTKNFDEKLIGEANKLERKRKCPDDKNLMTKEVVNEIVIDKCSMCGGIFLDKNELEIIKKRSVIDSSEFGYIIAFIVAFLLNK